MSTMVDQVSGRPYYYKSQTPLRKCRCLFRAFNFEKNEGRKTNKQKIGWEKNGPPRIIYIYRLEFRVEMVMHSWKKNSIFASLFLLTKTIEF